MEYVIAPTAPGELIDRLTILELRSERLRDEAKLARVRTELGLVRAALENVLPACAEIGYLLVELREVNRRLWDIENNLRVCERRGDFGEQFVRLARAVYESNDRRAAIKRAINDFLGAGFGDEKQYT